jgi:uncharacterized membrane protein YjfL (UPF0719 family)
MMNEFINEMITSLIEYTPWFAASILTALAVMSALPLMGKLIGTTSLRDELAQKDNFAVGYSLSGILFALGCIVAGASAGDFGTSFTHEILLMLTFAFTGLILLLASRFILDKLSLTKINLHAEIMKENSAAGIADAGNTIASGLILLNVMMWADSTEYIDVVWVFAAWIVSQSVLFLATIYRNIVQRKFGGKVCIQEQIRAGNSAVAIRFAGYRISIALAMMATSSVISFDFEDPLFTFLSWSILGLMFAILTTVIGVLLRKAVLRGINVWDEVENQANLGIAVIQSALFIVGSLIIIGINL